MFLGYMIGYTVTRLVFWTIGLAFMAVAGVDYFVGSSQQNIQLPEWLRGRTEIGDGAFLLGMGHYRLFIIAVCAVLTVVLQLILSKTRFGSRLRAAVDDPRVAAGLGINVNIVSLLTFAVGSGLAGLGGALGAEILGMDPTFPLKYMIYFLIVVSVGGTSSITGPLLAALMTGTVFVEALLRIPGLGLYFANAAASRDMPLLMGTALFFALILMVTNLVVDLIYGLLDPRIRTVGGGADDGH